MDYVRSGYETFMQTWQDSTDLTRVRWFRAAPDAKFFPKEHLFGSQKTWDRGSQNPPEHPGESGYAGWTNSANPLGYAGQQHCGSDTAMSLGGVHGVDPVLTTETNGWLACCGPMPACGVAIPDRWHVVWTSPAGCSCAGEIVMDLQLNEDETVPGVVYYWRIGAPGTYPLPWGAACVGGFDGWRVNMLIRLVVGDCAWLVQPQWELIGSTHFTRSAHPVISAGPDGPQLVADTLDVEAWSEYSPGQTIWEQGDCKVVIEDPDHRWVITALPGY